MSLIKSITYGIDVYNENTMSFTIPLNSRVLISGSDLKKRRKLIEYIKSKFFNNLTQIDDIYDFNQIIRDDLINSYQKNNYENGHIIIVKNINYYEKFYPYMDYIFYLSEDAQEDWYFLSKMIKTHTSSVYQLEKIVDNIKSNNESCGTSTYLFIKVLENEKSKSAKIESPKNETFKINKDEIFKINKVEQLSIPTPGELKELSGYIEFKNEFIISMKNAATNGETQYNQTYTNAMQYINKLSEELKNVGHNVKYNDSFICVFW